jgi:hypothetical protein
MPLVCALVPSAMLIPHLQKSFCLVFYFRTALSIARFIFTTVSFFLPISEAYATMLLATLTSCSTIVSSLLKFGLDACMQPFFFHLMNLARAPTFYFLKAYLVHLHQLLWYIFCLKDSDNTAHSSPTQSSHNPVAQISKKIFQSIDNLFHTGKQKSVDLTGRITHKSKRNAGF